MRHLITILFCLFSTTAWAVDGMILNGVGTITGKNPQSQELVIENIAFPILWTENGLAAVPNPAILDQKRIKFSGQFDGKKLSIDEAVEHSVIRKITPHAFFSVVGAYKDDVILVDDLKIEVNFVPVALRQTLETTGRAKANGVVEPRAEGLRFIILKLDAP